MEGAPGPDARAAAPGPRVDEAGLVAGARWGVLVYLAIVVLLSGALEGALIATRQKGLILGLMWTPALACALVRLVRREGFADVSFRFGGRRTWLALLLAVLLPFGVGLVAYVPAWLSGLATFAPPERVPGAGPAVQLLALAGLALAGGLLESCILALGEEIGWRGYLLPRLLDAHVPRALLVSGVIWGLWHLPLILSGRYAAGPDPARSALVFMAAVVPAAVLFGWARLLTGSVWPAVVAHGAWNSVIQSVFDAATTGPGAAVWTGESGLLTAAVLLALAGGVTAVVRRRGWPALREPPRRGQPAPTLPLASV
jgi:membrane protease YdiL (CAAX protease family)